MAERSRRCLLVSQIREMTIDQRMIKDSVLTHYLAPKERLADAKIRSYNHRPIPRILKPRDYLNLPAIKFHPQALTKLKELKLPFVKLKR